MKEIFEYCIISEYDLQKFEEKVNFVLRSGWKFHEKLLIYQIRIRDKTRDINNWQFTQQFVRSYHLSPDGTRIYP